MKQGADISWLGQAGFEITSPTGVKTAIDPYLGDSCRKLVGFKRMMPPPVSIADFEADALLISHEHPDHLDIDLMRALALRTEMPVFGNESCQRALADAGLDPERMTRIGVGDRFRIGDIEVTALPCDHGTQCVGPLAFLLKTGGVCIYFAGDTAYSPDLLRPAFAAKPDIALLPINGMYGNLDAGQAALLASGLKCSVLIPCHYWMFVEHGGDPLWLHRYAEREKGIRIVFLSPGESLHWEKE